MKVYLNESTTCTGCGSVTSEPTVRKNGPFCPSCIKDKDHAFLEKPKSV